MRRQQRIGRRRSGFEYKRYVEGLTEDERLAALGVGVRIL